MELRVERRHQLGIALLPTLDLVGNWLCRLSRQGLGHHTSLRGQVPCWVAPPGRPAGFARHAAAITVRRFRSFAPGPPARSRAPIADCSTPLPVCTVGRSPTRTPGPAPARGLSCLARRQPRCRHDDLATQAHDAVITVEVHAHEGNRLRWPRRAGSGRSRHHGRNGRPQRAAPQQRHQRLPVGDRAQALRTRLGFSQRGGVWQSPGRPG